MTKINNYFDYLHFTECDILGFKWEPKKKLGFNFHKKEHSFNFHAFYYYKFSNLLIQVKNLGILQGHPLNPPSNESSIIFWPKRCTCIFKEVQTSILQMNRYYEDPPGSQQFVPDPNQTPQEIEEVFSVDEPLNDFFIEPLNDFFIEGLYQHPVAWVEWEIKSRFFALEIDPKDEHQVLTGLEYSKLHGEAKKVEMGY
ncbi:hypothetical protein [Laspinema olomoucense]|uniref:Uncharacterized protein n=1 Tax=Laspinema olomoucense D3b TaxID=2953688 RepID=A0ABT2N5P9_9CYAN|nr:MULTISPECIES: hypothetical protein [unclassified Laspinema]MCT7972970.1 hypothetical protein [Laspinema sp. D3d]MCT7977988.1 hypothetical protein [Laspinema sp. D3b]MCT7987059.1 hypothetical protein [Laspinema sp. D3a]MCT7994237.1 hypothetical protein [Laspinema sp. D3c]